MTLDEAVLKALEHGSGNPREIAERLAHHVRTALNGLADAGKIERAGHPGRGIEKTFSLKAPAPIVRRF